MNLWGVKPGDIVYEVIIDFDNCTIYFGAMEVEDVATKEIKIASDWFEIDDNELVYDRQEAEKRAKELSEKYNYPVIREGLLRAEEDNGKTV